MNYIWSQKVEIPATYDLFTSFLYSWQKINYRDISDYFYLMEDFSFYLWYYFLIVS